MMSVCRRQDRLLRRIGQCRLGLLLLFERWGDAVVEGITAAVKYFAGAGFCRVWFEVKCLGSFMNRFTI